MSAPIVILTDFGNLDPYVGIMKGVISSLAPHKTCLDLTHLIPPGDIRRAAFVLWQSRPYFPPETTFLCVVDPGVGTSRRAIFLRTRQHNFIGPDNGLFTYLLNSSFDAWALQNPDLALPQPSQTFHGRDLFAPAAAHASLGVPGATFGNPVTDPVQFELPRLAFQEPSRWQGEILHADQYGNLITSLGRFEPGSAGTFDYHPWLNNGAKQLCQLSSARLQLADGRQLPYAQTFGDIPDGQGAFLLGSTGLLEIVANRQSAANLLNLSAGAAVTLFEPENGAA